MNRLILILALLTFSALLAVGQSSSDEQSVKRIEREMVAGVLKGNASVFEKHLADSYVFTGPDGIVMNKTENIAPLKSGELKFESSKYDDMKVQLYGNTAIVTYRSTDKGTYKGSDLTGQYRWTDVFVKRDGRWQVAATQGTRLTQQK